MAVEQSDGTGIRFRTPFGDEIEVPGFFRWRTRQERVRIGHGPREGDEQLDFHIRAFCPPKLAAVVRTTFWDLFDLLNRECRLSYLEDDVRLEVKGKRPAISGQRSMGGRVVDEVEVFKEILPR